MEKELLEFNAKLQQKKNALRKALKEKGILKRDGNNKFDGYKYFSEAQYKQLFTELLSDNKLELKFNELDYSTFEGSAKQSNGRMVKIEFDLIDVETGYSESSIITGEGIDKGDKAGYKAYTGALKYYLANTFMVATGDDPEVESPSENMNQRVEKKATPNQIQTILGLVSNIDNMLKAYHVEKVEDLTMYQASEIISIKKGGK